MDIADTNMVNQDPHLAGGMSFIMMEYVFPFTLRSICRSDFDLSRGLEALQPIPAYYKDFH